MSRAKKNCRFTHMNSTWRPQKRDAIIVFKRGRCSFSWKNQHPRLIARDHDGHAKFADYAAACEIQYRSKVYHENMHTRKLRVCDCEITSTRNNIPYFNCVIQSFYDRFVVVFVNHPRNYSNNCNFISHVIESYSYYRNFISHIIEKY